MVFYLVFCKICITFAAEIHEKRLRLLMSVIVDCRC